MTIQNATKQLNKVKEIFEHLKYHGWINDIKKDIDTNDVIEAINTILVELDKQKEIKAEMRKVAFEEGFEQGRIKGIMEAAKEA